MSLRRIAFALMLPLAACAAGVEDPQDPAAEDSPAVPAHAISVDEPTRDRRIDVRSTLDERANLREIALWDFEPASADCNGWTAFGAKAIRAIPSHTGSYACKLCADGSSPEMSLTRRVAGLPRGRWVVSAWLRRLGESNARIAAHVAIDELSDRAYPPSKILLVQDWKLLGDPLDVSTEIASATLSIVATATKGECILVDDVYVESAAAAALRSSLPATSYAFIHR